VLSRANALLYPDTPHNLFVTCLFAVLDPRTGRLRYANAGHVPPLRRQAGETGSVDQLRARGMPLGLMPDSAYEEKEAIVAYGETVLFYSDGLTEAHDAEHRMFDIGRLTAVTASGRAEGSALIERVLTELGRFTGSGWEQEDDLMLLTLERQEDSYLACQTPHKPQACSSTRLDRTPALSTSAAR
jgi:serine phosphatase RsbU (regulator of sigma subunit)